MADDQKALDQKAAAAIAAAQFDERTPEEAGFAQVFENQIKPKLAEDAGEPLRIQNLRKRRLTILILVGIFLAYSLLKRLLPLVTGIFTNNVSPDALGGLVFRLFAYMIIFGGLLSWANVTKFKYSSLQRADAFKLVASQFNATARKVDENLLTIEKRCLEWPFTGIFFSGEKISGQVGHAAYDAWLLCRPLQEEAEFPELQAFNGKPTTGFAWLILAKLPANFSATTAIFEKGGVEVDFAEDMQEVILESDDFNERFKISSTNQVEARVLLSPDVMEHLLHFRKPANAITDLRITVRADQTQIILPVTADSFEFWSVHDPKRLIEEIHMMFAEVSMIYKLVSDIDAIAESEGRRGDMQRTAS